MQEMKVEKKSNKRLYEFSTISEYDMKRAVNQERSYWELVAYVCRSLRAWYFGT